MWCSIVIQRHGTCPCGVLLSYKDTVPVPVVLYYQGICPCGTLLSHKDTVSVPVVLYCHTKTRYLSLRCFTVIQSHDTYPCGAPLSYKDMVPVPAVLYCHKRHGTCLCGALLSYKDTCRVYGRQLIPQGPVSDLRVTVEYHVDRYCVYG